MTDMTDMLFIELGAVVTEILGSTQCTIEPFCVVAPPPTYSPANRFTVDFAWLLDSLRGQPMDVAAIADQAQYDLIVAPMTGRRVQIGPNWPSGGCEGILCIRDNIVKEDLKILGPAAEKLVGPRYKYQVIVSFVADAVDKSVRRYHGFHAEGIEIMNGSIKFQIKSVDRTGKIIYVPITYDPNASDATVKFYTGNLVADNIIIQTNLTSGQTGPVFINLDLDAGSTLSSQLIDELPKLPPGAGL